MSSQLKKKSYQEKKSICSANFFLAGHFRSLLKPFGKWDKITDGYPVVDWLPIHGEEVVQSPELSASSVGFLWLKLLYLTTPGPPPQILL